MVGNTDNKRITELLTLGKLSGKEYILIDNDEDTHKVTVDQLLGYIAAQINAGTYPQSMIESTKLVLIPEGEEIPVVERIEGSYYIEVSSIEKARHYGLLPTNIRVSPNMGLKIIND